MKNEICCFICSDTCDFHFKKSNVVFFIVLSCLSLVIRVSVLIFLCQVILKQTRPQLHTLFSCSAQLSMKFITPINVSMLTILAFLAHLSRRLIGELIVYQWSGVRRRPSSSFVVRRRRPSSTMLKHLLLRNRLADQSQILCGASLGRGNEILFAASGSHDQDGRHAHIWKKPFKNLLL